MPDNPNHNADGTFAKGNTLGSIVGRTTWRKRVEQLDTTYDTAEKLLALFILDVNDVIIGIGPELKKMHPRDVAILRQSAEAMTGCDRIRERETFFDRDEGRARQSIAVAGDPDNPTPISVTGVFSLNFAPEDGDGGDQPTAPTPPDADVEKA